MTSKWSHANTDTVATAVGGTEDGARPVAGSCGICRRAHAHAAARFRQVRRWDSAVIEHARRYSLVLVRLALASVFIWFGALKLLGATPVADLVGKAAPFLPQGTAVLATGAVEVAIGLGLLTRLLPRLTLALFFALLLGTFSLLITNPEIAFGDGNPLKLTTTGEFICKNIVLLSAGVILVAATPTRTERKELGR